MHTHCTCTACARHVHACTPARWVGRLARRRSFVHGIHATRHTRHAAYTPRGIHAAGPVLRVAAAVRPARAAQRVPPGYPCHRGAALGRLKQSWAGEQWFESAHVESILYCPLSLLSMIYHTRPRQFGWLLTRACTLKSGLKYYYYLELGACTFADRCLPCTMYHVRRPLLDLHLTMPTAPCLVRAARWSSAA